MESRGTKRARRGIRFAGAVCAALALTVVAACGSSKNNASGGSGKTSGTPLEGTLWSLAPGNDVGNMPKGVVVTALFQGGKLSGSSGCNNYTGSYTLKGSSLTISNDVASTQIACDPTSSAVEKAYLALLPKVASYAISGSTLTLKGSDGKTVLTYAASGPDALTGKWTVIAYYSGNAITSVLGNATLTADFEKTTVSGDSGCNTFNGPFSTSGASNIKIGPLAKTARACADPEVDKQEQQYLAALQLASTYAVAGNSLDLFRADGGYAVQFQKG